MKKINTALSLLISLLIISLSANAQNTDFLDERFGFQNFKFNTPYSNYSKYNPVKKNDGHYELQNINDVTIGSYEIESLELFFKNSNLVKVKVKLDDQDRQKNESIFNALIKNYGRYTFHRSTSGYTYTSEMIWKGKLVNLVYSFTSYREGGQFQTKIFLTYSYIGEALEVDLSEDL
jgi:hypothetical protein